MSGLMDNMRMLLWCGVCVVGGWVNRPHRTLKVMLFNYKPVHPYLGPGRLCKYINAVLQRMSLSDLPTWQPSVTQVRSPGAGTLSRASR